MRIQTNVESLNAYRNLNNTNRSMSKSMEKLSSGFRINRAADDAAGLAISEKMRGQISGLNQATRNSQDATSMIQTAEGALNESHEILQRMRELANQSANDTNTAEDRAEIQKEVDQLANELSRITNTTEFNTQNLLSGAFEENNFQVGANEGQSIDLSIGAMDANSLGMAEDVESVEAEVVDTTDGVIGADITEGEDGSFFTEGEYTVEFNDDGTEATLLNPDGEELDTVTATADSAETLTFNTDDGTLEVYKDGADMSDAEETINIGASGADLDPDATTADITSVQADDAATETLGDGDFTIELAEGGTEDVIEIARVVDEDGNVLGEYDGDGTQIGADESIDIELDDGGTVTFSTDADLTDDTEEASFRVVDSDYESGVSTAAVYEDGEVIEDANVVKGIDVQSHENATEALTKIDAAIEEVSSQRSELGSLQNRLEHTIANLEVASENLEAAESRIRDVDMAHEMTEFSKQQILEQAGTAMLAQANQAPQSVLQLLG